MKKAVYCILLMFCLQPFVVHAQPFTPEPEPVQDERFGGSYAINVSYRIVGCAPSRNSVWLTAKKVGSRNAVEPTSFSIGNDDRQITTVYATFENLIPSGYTITAGISDAACSGGSWLRGSVITTSITRARPEPTLTFIYAANERETTLDMSSLMNLLDGLLKSTEPTIRLDNHGPEHDGSRLLENGSWLRYKLFWMNLPETKTIRFTIPEVRQEVVDGTLGVYKYYINNVDSITPGPGVSIVAWDTTLYRINVSLEFDGSGTEVKGYYKGLFGLSDRIAPDIDSNLHDGRCVYRPFLWILGWTRHTPGRCRRFLCWL